MDLDDKVEKGTALIIGSAAAWAILYKVVAPICKWFRNWLSTGSKIDDLTNLIHRELNPNGTPLCAKIEEIHATTMLLSAREALRFENSPVPGYECDASGLCISVNPAWCKLFGVTEHNMLGNGWLSVIIDPQERERVLDNWTKSVKNRYTHREQYKAQNAETKEILWCKSSTVEVTSKEGKTLLYAGTIQKCGPDWTPLP